MPAAPRDLPFACACGTVKGTLRGVTPARGSHAQCHCIDCRAAEVYLDQPDPAPRAIQLFQTTPDRFHFDQGFDKLSVFSFGETNLLRWYASCCGTPMFNTLRKPKLAFASIMTRTLSDPAPLGPIVGTGYIPTPSGKLRNEGLPRLIWGALSRAAGAKVTGRWTVNPFIDPDTATPKRPVHIVPRDQRKAITEALR